MTEQDDNNPVPENGHAVEERPRHDADKGREPELVAGQLGRRLFSMNALVERIESAFVEEHGEDSPELRDVLPARTRDPFGLEHRDCQHDAEERHAVRRFGRARRPGALQRQESRPQPHRSGGEIAGRAAHRSGVEKHPGRLSRRRQRISL